MVTNYRVRVWKRLDFELLKYSRKLERSRKPRDLLLTILRLETVTSLLCRILFFSVIIFLLFL
uniref:Uncharacterized protein n=1 Tax=Octopus bimaculoides TaxID=37653 RepID=A0A0L8HA75_OCTBM